MPPPPQKKSPPSRSFILEFVNGLEVRAIAHIIWFLRPMLTKLIKAMAQKHVILLFKQLLIGSDADIIHLLTSMR